MGKIDDLIDGISGNLARAAVQKDLKAELAGFLQKARNAADKYTVHKYRELLKRWEDQDKHIAELINTLKAQPDWHQGLSEVCPVLFDPIKQLDEQLAGTKSGPPDPKAVDDLGLYWKRTWQLGQRDSLKRVHERQAATLRAWENPAATLEKTLADDAGLIDEARKTIGQQPAPTLAFDLFVKLVPMHLHIAPPGVASAVAPIGTVLPGAAPWKDSCAFGAGRLIGDAPKLIEPKDYPAKYEEILSTYHDTAVQLAEAESELKKTDDAIARSEKQITERITTVDKDAKAALQA